MTPTAKKVARLALESTFAGVRKRLLFVFDTPTDATGIHKLRVSVRRATAALDAFAPCLPRRTHKAARRTLRTIRRTAGSARDWDVFFPVASEWANTQPDEVRPFADALMGWSAGKRDSAQAGLVTLASVHPEALDAMLIDVLDALRRPRGFESVAELGRERVRTLEADLATACEHEPAADADYHRVRIVGKQLRYAAELYPECATTGLDDDLRALQDILGRFNDGAVGAEHLSAFARHYQTFHPAEWERLAAGAAALDSHFAAQRETERTRFREWRAARRTNR